MLFRSGRYTDRAEEGCLSIPDVRAPIMRPLSVRIEALDRTGGPIADEADDLRARIWQHEVDHLDGVLILDRMTPADLRANRRAIAALEGR